jgi:type VI secretion system protein ImpG
VRTRQGEALSHEFLPASAIRPVGFADDEALLPVTLRSFQGYRLLQEYFAFPARYRFVEVCGLSRAVARADTGELEIVILLGQGDPTFERVVDASNLALFCTPAINLFERRAERVHVTDEAHEYHVVVDRTRPLDFEVYAVTGVVGHGVGADSEQEFRPFYSAFSADAERPHTAYFTTRREPWLDSSTVKRHGPRSSYVKVSTEVFLSLVDAAQAPYGGDLRQLSVEALCTNRDLVLQMPVGVGRTDLALDIAAPVTAIRIVSGPSRPYAPLAEGSIAWRAIGHLSLNYLSLVDSDDRHGASALRDLLDLYAAKDDATARRQIAGIQSVAVTRVVRRLPGGGPLAFGRGLEVTVRVDELAFAGASAFLLGSVLARYFARHVSINAFTETVLRSDTRGEIHRWGPQWGARPTL